MVTTVYPTFNDPKYQRSTGEGEERAIFDLAELQKKGYLDHRNDVAIDYLLSCRSEKGFGQAFK